jgi:hypothetical protein
VNKLYSSDNFKEKFCKYASEITEYTGELKVETYNNAVVLPYYNSSHSSSPGALNVGGVFDYKGNIIELSKTKVSEQTVHVGAPEIYNVEQKFRYIDDDVIFLGNFSTHFGHFLIESMSRLWIYLDNNFFGKKAVYIGKSDVFFIELLEIFGLDKKNIARIKVPTRFRSVIIPEQANMLYERTYHKKYKEIYNKIRTNSRGYFYDKIYLSRKKFQKEKSAVCGEYEIEKIFEDNGFKIVYPEKVSIKKQIELMKNCKHLAGIQGSAIHLSLFAADGIELTVIYRKHEDIFPAQIKINKMKDIKNTSIEASLDFLRPFPSNIEYAVSIRNKYMREWLKDMKYKTDEMVYDPVTFEDYIGREEYKKLNNICLWKRKLKEKIIMLLTNFIFIKSLRKKIRYRLINR